MPEFGLPQAGAALLLAGVLTAPATADEVADFYKGRTLQVVVGYGPGGGNDVYARLLARHMGRHVPGNPGLVVQNMPGAGSLVAANHLANAAAKDGTAIGTFARNLPLVGVIGGNPNIRFDPRKLVWLGSASSYRDDAYILWVRPEAKTRSIEDARKSGGEPLVLAGTSEGDTSYDVPVLLRQTLGLNIKLIGGYRDSNGMFLAIEGKEVDGRVADLSSVSSSRAHWLKPGAMLTLLQFGRATRHKDFTGVPTARELATTAANRTLIEVMEAPFALTRPYVAPPGTPEPRAKALQAAFMAVQKDPAYLEEAGRLKLDVSPIGPAEVLALLERIAAAPEPLKAQVRQLVGAAKGN
jgi:tripartite-type tricarboxylate transporter receptor subunit TctC